MKRHYKFILSLLFSLLILFTGCNTDDSDDPNPGTAPTISDVAFYTCEDADKSNPQMSISINDGDYYYRRINYRDPDLDIRFVHVTIYVWDGDGYIEYDGPDVSELPPQESEFDWDEDINAKQMRLPSGSYRYQFQLEDKKNNMSDKFRVNIRVD